MLLQLHISNYKVYLLLRAAHKHTSLKTSVWVRSQFDKLCLSQCVCTVWAWRTGTSQTSSSPLPLPLVSSLPTKHVWTEIPAGSLLEAVCTNPTASHVKQDHLRWIPSWSSLLDVQVTSKHLVSLWSSKLKLDSSQPGWDQKGDRDCNPGLSSGRPLGH